MLNTLYTEYLALVINYPELLDKTILKDEYFDGKDKIMFSILFNFYKKNHCLVISDLINDENFNIDYFVELQESNIYTSSKNTKFKRLEQDIIEQYKIKKLNEFRNSIPELRNSEDINNFFKGIENIKEIKVLENSNITTEKMLNTLMEQKTQVKLGFTDLDKLLVVEQNDFVVVAGGTGSGKSSFALNLLSNMSKEYQCVYFNMEMPEKTLYKRLCAIETGIDIRKLNNFSELSSQEYKIINETISDIGSRNIIMLNGRQTIESISKSLMNVDTDKHIVVILDHIGLINAKGNGLYEKMTNVAKGIRVLCFDCDCTIFGLCQLSRESQKEERIPKLQDLRDSGEIEQSARKVLLLYNKDLKNDNRIKDITLYIAKNDTGGHAGKEMKFDVYQQKFYEIQRN